MAICDSRHRKSGRYKIHEKIAGIVKKKKNKSCTAVGIQILSLLICGEHE